MASDNPAAILECFKLLGVQKTGVTLGRGSYAQVIELRYRELICAGKELYPVPLPTDDLSVDKTLAVLERVKKECVMLSSLKHPNIVQFMGVYFDQVGPLPLLVMEYVPFTLSQHLEKHQPYPPEVSYGILIDVAKALCYLHGGDPIVIHRDLSANNVLLTTEMNAKVSDLGTAKRLSERLNQHHTRCPGTLVYMPPEVYGKDPFYNETLDCFSYGVLTLHIFSGKWPVAKDSVVGNTGGMSEIDRRQKFVDKMGTNHSLMGLVKSCLSEPQQRPSAIKILERVSEVRGHECRSKTDKLSLLLQTDGKRIDKMEETIAKLQIKQHNMEDKHAAEMNESENKIEELLNDVEELKLFLEQLKKDRKVEEDRVQMRDREIAELKDKMETEREAIKKRAEEEMDAYKKSKEEEVNVKEAEMNNYKEILNEKERKLDEIIHRATERQRRYKSEETYETKIHPLHHNAKRFKWRKLPELPIGMTAPQCVYIDSTLYIGGGQTVNTDKELRKTIFEYETTSDKSWKTRFPKSPTMYFGLGELDGKLVVVGGQRETEDKEMVVTGEVFLLDGNQLWSSEIIPSMTCPRMRACVVSHKGCMAACGGLETKSTKQCSSVVELYRSETKTWCIIEALPLRRAALRATVINKTLYLLGGFYPDLTGVSECDCLSIELEDLFRDHSSQPSHRSWRSDIAGTPYYSSAPGNICGTLLAIGGALNRQNPSLTTDSISAYSPVVNKWYHIGSLPTNLSSATCCTLPSGELVVFGGRVSEDRNTQVYIGSLE